MFVVDLPTITGPQCIINFPTKKHWKARSRLADIEAGLQDLVKVIERRGIRSLAVPPLGVGNGGLPWDEVESSIVKFLGNLPGVEVHLYNPSNAARHLIANPIRMTWGRATTIKLMQQYAAHRLAVEPWEPIAGVSHLEIQKLMYFANHLSPGLRLRFEQGIYGPYSEQVRHLIQEMEAVYLTGFGDGTAPVLRLDSIEPTESGLKEADCYIDHSKTGKEITSHIIDPVMNIVDGFEGPYAIELLASTHWVATNEGCNTPDKAWSTIQKWSARKSRLFTQAHVKAAWQKLERSSIATMINPDAAAHG